MPDSSSCPLCRSGQLATVSEAGQIGREIQRRDAFITTRLRRSPEPGEAKDLTDFMHGLPAPLTACPHCGVLIRREDAVREAHTYEEDPNDRDLMQHVLPRYIQAFRNKEDGYRGLLRPNAEVLELGPHLGAFLEVSEGWSWRPTGVDIGKDTADFCQARGLRVIRRVMEETRFPANHFDAVFIWNCFEQLADPETTLQTSYRLLKTNGLLTIRVPNPGFYELFAAGLAPAGGDDSASLALAYNNLLGFPYLYGYTPGALNRLLWKHGYILHRVFNSELVTMPFADLTRELNAEQRAISDEVSAWSTRTSQRTGRLTGPWIEMVYRKVTENDWRARQARDPGTLGSRLQRRLDLRFQKRAA